MAKTIVKVQTSQAASPKFPQVLVYAEGRRGFWQGNDKPAFDLLGGPLKKGYFYATLRGQRWEIGERAPDQDW